MSELEVLSHAERLRLADLGADRSVIRKCATAMAHAADGRYPGCVCHVGEHLITVATATGIVQAHWQIDDPAADGTWVLLADAADAPSVVALISGPGRDGHTDIGGSGPPGRPAWASQVDSVFLVIAADRLPGRARLDYLATIAWESGATPVAVVTRTDIATREQRRDCFGELAASCPAIPVVAASPDGRRGGELLGQHARPGRVIALVGGHGAGKSTVAAMLLRVAADRLGIEAPVIRPGQTRLEIPGGGVILDPVGGSSLHLGLGSRAGHDGPFADLAEFRARCRFADCQHEHEPGCAVRAAIDDGALDPARLAAYQRLDRESEYRARRLDPRARREHVKIWIARAADGLSRARP